MIFFVLNKKNKKKFYKLVLVQLKTPIKINYLVLDFLLGHILAHAKNKLSKQKIIWKIIQRNYLKKIFLINCEKKFFLAQKKSK